MSHFHLAPESEERFRAITHHSLHLVHNRYRCACGKQVTAKHMTQFGRCPTCQNAAARLKSFHVTVKRQAGIPLRMTVDALDWLDVHTSALEQFWPCSVSVRLA